MGFTKHGCEQDLAHRGILFENTEFEEGVRLEDTHWLSLGKDNIFNL